MLLAAALALASGLLLLPSTLSTPPLLQLHSLHSDLAVLQQGKPCFTGRSAIGDKVTVTVTTQGGGQQLEAVSEASGTVAAGGYWKVCLTTPLVPSLANHTITYRAAPSGSEATNVGVLVGNVILCSG